MDNLRDERETTGYEPWMQVTSPWSLVKTVTIKTRSLGRPVWDESGSIPDIRSLSRITP